ncbi:hypothetical protein U729_2617 [Clostridium baratii str. Sullivan]|uniref:Uncharacterized protein n=1 Tax=Clostridium baratii str. Sullivan TaxID=1415775 RepID=A0A0A7FW51_9CLOT|nr:hypothetical protein [Clostridium baratii]AIY83091.1 hypothetical protein U729_2617 [Clostridium baratii str. Sullivan]
MAKLTNKEIIEKVGMLGELSNRKLPVKVSYAIGKNISKIESELKHYNKARKNILEKYCEKDEEGNLKIEDGNYVIKENEKENWNKDIKDLDEIVVEIDTHTFNIDLLNGYEMSPSEMMCIDFMLEE